MIRTHSPPFHQYQYLFSVGGKEPVTLEQDHRRDCLHSLSKVNIINIT